MRPYLNPMLTVQRQQGKAAFFEKGEDPERTSKMSNNEEFYVKVKFIPGT